MILTICCCCEETLRLLLFGEPWRAEDGVRSKGSKGKPPPKVNDAELWLAAAGGDNIRDRRKAFGESSEEEELPKASSLEADRRRNAMLADGVEDLVVVGVK